MSVSLVGGGGWLLRRQPRLTQNEWIPFYCRTCSEIRAPPDKLRFNREEMFWRMHFGILRQSTMDGGKCTFPFQSFFVHLSLSLSLFLSCRHFMQISRRPSQRRRRKRFERRKSWHPELLDIFPTSSYLAPNCCLNIFVNCPTPQRTTYRPLNRTFSRERLKIIFMLSPGNHS